MSESITITCPHCSFSKTIRKKLLPEKAIRAICASCKQSFPLNLNAPSPPLPAASDAPNTPPLSFKFTGTALEYFGIWIVNTLLKIITLGIYSAWAKVRTRRFIYGSTSLQGQAFEYLADPMALFKGWLIAACAFILYIVASRIDPLLSAAIAIIIFLAFPWLLVRSKMFNARNSSHRNIRFGFQPDYGQAYVVYAGLPILTVLTLGILFPYMLYRQQKFLVEQSSYGSTPFTFTATGKDFYAIAFKVLLAFFIVGIVFLIICIIIAGLAIWFTGGLSALSSRTDLKTVQIITPAVLTIISPLVYFLIVVYGQTALANLCWNETKFRGSQFISKLQTGKMAYLFITNLLAILFSLGLLMPWVTVRMARYRSETLFLASDGSIDSIVAAALNKEAISATGEEIGDVFDMPTDFGL